MPIIFEDVVCSTCSNILFAKSGDIEAEIICPSCRTINYAGRENQAIGLRGKDFQIRSINHDCLKCGRLIMRSIGLGKVKARCARCSQTSSYDTISMRNGTQEPQRVLDKMIAR